MKLKTAAVVLSLGVAVFAVSTHAEALEEKLKSFPMVNLLFNGANDGENPASAIAVHGEPLILADELGKSMHALTDWNRTTQTLDIYKPNVSIFLCEGIGDKPNFDLQTPFGKVKHNNDQSFFVFVQVDSLKTKIQALKITIEDPDGNEVASKEEAAPEPKESFWYISPFSLIFKEVGNYTVKFSMKHNDTYTVVSEKKLLSYS